MPDVNQIELKLLESLQQSGKLPPKEIAHEVNLSPTPVYGRIRRLEKGV